MKLSIVAALLLSGCASVSVPWINSGVDVPVQWVRAPGANAKVVDGVCVVTHPDEADGQLLAIEGLVRQCVNIGGLRPERRPGVELVRWHESNSLAELNRMYVEAYPSAKSTGFAVGFYFKSGQRCHVATLSGRRAFGHELKHCFDGLFHV